VLGVIPAIGSGLAAFLALLFPALFGGLLLTVRRWSAALAVLSLNSTLFLLHAWAAPRLGASWWATSSSLWMSMTIVTLVGLLWAWKRHLNAPPAMLGWGELLMLLGVSLGFGAEVIVWRSPLPPKFDPNMRPLWPLAAGVWAATVSCFCRRVVARRGDARQRVPGEGILLWSGLAAGIGLAAVPRPEAPAGPAPEANEPYRLVWSFRPPVEQCWFASSPAVEGGGVYIGAAIPNLFHPAGAVYCLERDTGKLAWSFDDDGRMKEVFSSPCVADGRLYIGEGFHQDTGCKIYCLDAATGTKLWDFPTRSHTESSPCVADGRVYCGAGDDGLYCLGAADGKVVWHFEGLHVDAGLQVTDGRVYGGSGIGDLCKETAVFCLDAATGKQFWRVPTDLPVWATPTLSDGQLFVALGNGNVLESAGRAAGAVLCLEAATGRRRWPCDAGDGVMARVAVDDAAVYFVSRDGRAYCAGRSDGSIKWRSPSCGEPILASPALVDALYVVTSRGQLCQLDPRGGETRWQFRVEGDGGEPLVLSSPAVQRTGVLGRRRIWFGCGRDGPARGMVYCIEDRAEEWLEAHRRSR
jgi:outer membrane protein assembly factor BamB